MSVFEQILGEDFQRLHPKLQQRYTLPSNGSLVVEGVMEQIASGGAWMTPALLAMSQMKMLFPEQGENIPFRMKNTSIEHANGLIEVLWERYFEFPKRMRQFNSHMYLNPQTGKVFEYLGDPGIIGSELTFHVTNEGFLMIRTKNTNAKLFDVKIPLPNLTEVDVMAEEMYDEKLGQYRIIVYISHSIIGRMVYYKGYFNLKND